MKKLMILAIVLMILFGFLGLMQDMNDLQNGMIRLHVVGASDSQEDQNVKLMVKDAVNYYLARELTEAKDTDQALQMIRIRLPELKDIAEQILREHGFSESVDITLEKECFPRREYDTFSLPSGVYTALRIRIGDASGRNWWCVVFPTLCIPAAGEDFQSTAAGAGFSDSLTNTLSGQEEYELRFFFLDLLGQVQNFFSNRE